MSHISCAREGAVSIIRLARPEKKNALTVAMYQGLVAALSDAAADDSVHAALISGAPGCFTAGNDIGDFMANPPENTDTPVFRFLEALATFPKPLLAAVDGAAVGIGTTLLLHCDHVLATPGSKFRMPFVALGVVPEGGSSVLLAERVGPAKANEWLLLGRPFSGEEALSAGLINELVDSDLLETTALARAAAYAAQPPGAMRAAKELLRGPGRPELLATMRREGEAFLQRLATEEAIGAMMGFLSK